MLRAKFVSLLFLTFLYSSLCLSQAATAGFFNSLGPVIGPNNPLPDLSTRQFTESLFSAIINGSRNSTSAGTDLSKVEGSPYFTPEFQSSNLWYKKELIGSYYIRYNAFQDQLEVKNSNLAEDEYQFLVRSADLKTQINGKELQYFSHKDLDGIMRDSYFFKEFAGDDFALYSNQRKKYSPPKASANTLAQSIPAKFMDDTSLYYKTKDGNVLNEIPKRKKDFFQIFPSEKRAELKKYVKTKRLKITDLDDLKSVIIYSDSI